RPGGDGSTYHAYVRDLERGRTKLIDRTSGGQISNDDSRGPSISAGGRFVAFRSQGSNLPGGNGTRQEIYLRDLKTGRTKLVSKNNAGEAQDGDAFEGRVADDGRI